MVRGHVPDLQLPEPVYPTDIYPKTYTPLSLNKMNINNYNKEIFQRLAYYIWTADLSGKDVIYISSPSDQLSPFKVFEIFSRVTWGVGGGE